MVRDLLRLLVFCAFGLRLRLGVEAKSSEGVNACDRKQVEVQLVHLVPTKQVLLV